MKLEKQKEKQKKGKENMIMISLYMLVILNLLLVGRCVYVIKKHGEYLEITKANLIQKTKEIETLKNDERLENLELRINASKEDLKELVNKTNDIYFKNLPLQNKIVNVRSIKAYDYTSYLKDIESLNDELKKGWSIISIDRDDFVYAFRLGFPLKGVEENEL